MPSGDNARHAINKPYFFLSYAQTPRRNPGDRNDPNRWVYKLYQDLCYEILTITDALPESAGFMDRENRIGVRWDRELAHALATCSVFIPLYSERYFTSENCGKEWFAFARREAKYRGRSGLRTNAIIPVLWAPVDQDKMPTVAQKILNSHPDFGGARYKSEGFYGIIKLKRYHNDYEMAVHQLARRIVEVARETQLELDKPAEFSSLQNAFASANTATRIKDQLHITVLALDASTRPPNRAAHYYGTSPLSWAPYFPHFKQPLAELAAELTSCMGWTPTIDVFDEDTSARIASGQLTAPILCLVDPWTSVSPVHQERLRRLEELQVPWLSVLVPWNGEDGELMHNSVHLRASLSAALESKLGSIPYQCRIASQIPSIQEFGDVWPKLMMRMMKRFQQAAPAYLPDGERIKRPRLRSVDQDDGEVST